VGALFAAYEGCSAVTVHTGEAVKARCMHTSTKRKRVDCSMLTVFVGANSSGKTSVLERIHLAVRAVTPQASKKEPDFWKPRPEKVFGWERHCDWI
jgi:hypothetical protein